MAVELLATAFLTVAFQKLFERLASREFADFFRGKKSVDDQLKILAGKLKTTSLLLDDAEDKQVIKPKVKEWLDELKGVVFKVEDLVEDIDDELRSKTEHRKQPGCGMCVPMKLILTFFTPFDKTVQAEIKMLCEDLDILLNRVVVLDLKHGSLQKAGSSRSASIPFAPLREETLVYGRDSDKEEILDLLLYSDDRIWGSKIDVLPIVGMGGLGKTTLAQLVYDDRRVEDHSFEHKAWVTVSTEFDVSRIIKSLLQQIGSTSHTEEPAILQREMREVLRGKMFLFVFDDVWDEDYDNWDLLMSCFTTGDSRSKIIVTTRSTKVCSNVRTGPIHELELVSNDDCWKIFVYHAFDGDSNADPELQEIGKRIVEKCKGLPLAVKSIGGLLRSETNPAKWESILESHVWEWSKTKGNGVLPSLWLSYRYLPSCAKRCFAYCSIFPQDHMFDKDDVILWWMAEGFLCTDSKEKSLEEVGDEYFEYLISRSFFQRHYYYSFNYVMHDLVHDLAKFVFGEFDRNKKSGNTSKKTRYLCPNDTHTTEEIHESGRLRILSLQGNPYYSSVLSLSRNHLKYLRFLNLSNSDIEEVPDSVGTLYHLQTLKLSHCYRLSKLPTNMGNLINLRHLNTYKSPIMKMPLRMGNLKELRILTDFVLGEANDGCSGIQELGEHRHLGSSLQIRGLQNVDAADDAGKANLRDKAAIWSLVLEWEGEHKNTRREAEVLNALKPHTNLMMLSISGYGSSSFPTWVGDSSFSKMVSVELKGSWINNICRSLPPLGQLPFLRKLKIEFFNGVEKIGSEFCGSNSSITTPFKCLETLEFVFMENWKEWSFAGNESGCFPRLKDLKLIMCPNLEAQTLLKCGRLETLEIQDSCNSMECFPLDKLRRLKTLSLNGFPNLKSLTNNRTEERLPVSLTSLWISNCPEMESFPGEGLPLSLKSLEIDDCKNLVAQNRHWNLQQLTSLTSLTVRSFDAVLDSFPIGLLPTSLTSFKLKRFRRLKSLNGDAFQNVKSLKELVIQQCIELESFPEQVLLPRSLLNLIIEDCPFLERRCRGIWQSISHIENVSISGSTTRELDREEAENRPSESSSASDKV